MNCPHIHIKCIREISFTDMNQRQQCDECSDKVGEMWMCMQRCCSFVGCGRHSKNHVESHHQKTDHAIYVCKKDRQVWCFGCGRKLEDVKLAFSRDIDEYQEMEEEYDSDDNDTMDMEEEAAMIDKDYFDGFEKGMKPRGLTGLVNIGNTCYMNSALQALSNSPSLMQFFLECPGYVRYLSQANVSEKYRLLVTEMWSKKRPKSVNPSDLMSCFQKLNPQFRGFRQQDTQEFLRVLMDLLHEELKEPVPPVANIQDASPEKPVNNVSTRSKRLLGGQTMQADRQNGELPQNGSRKSRTNRYNLRSFSRRKAEAMKTNSQREAVDKPVTEDNVVIKDTLLSNSRSCPELREELTSQAAGDPSVEPKEPAISMGFVNMASDHSEGNDTDEEESNFERSVSDSEINYYHLGGYGERNVNSEQKPAAVEYSSIISDLFNGKIRSSVQCLTCKKISSTMETFQDLSLPIPGKEELSAIHSTTQCNPIMSYSSSDSSRGIFGTLFDWISSWIFGPRVSFEDCLAAFFSADELKGDNMYRCEHCSMLRNGMKECKVFKLPEMLCIHLKRFRHEYYHSSKISSFISFPLEAFDVKKYLTNDFSGKCTKYDLVAIITHHGSVGGGHYVAYCKNFVTAKWYEFNDSYVTEVSASYVQSCEAYVLFYRKRGEDIVKYRQKFFRLSKRCEGQPTTHYISKKWMTMFYTCAEPGPISNNSFMCKHEAIDPLKESFVNDLVSPLQQTCWDFLLKKFGGGPEVKTLDICPICKIFDNSDSSGPQYIISLKWFKEWKNFGEGVNKDPPGPINNFKIGLQRKRVPKAVWDFLYSVYGGKPVLPVDEA
ncbi:ubiquitin carboxyl-terminal hydrolase 33-like isoform X2 [Dendronephthya gigantea]|uniref:ubiquitin carboxyl-terminal hydrolase 33-like isoform X2 n=1 Tax=Dendronephthya gigantea TaxID=151771 RepID=UPI00106A02E1|nr:ubiquitin carboxyl-terminal hydrolase 33-like isoform X2 [Dendronephthya gigantea]